MGKLRDQKAPPKKGACITLDDPEDSDDAKGRRNKGKPDRMRMEREKAKKKVEAASSRDRTGELTKSKEMVMTKHFEKQNGHV
jgi:hypothetical protein